MLTPLSFSSRPALQNFRPAKRKRPPSRACDGGRLPADTGRKARIGLLLFGLGLFGGCRSLGSGGLAFGGGLGFEQGRRLLGGAPGSLSGLLGRTLGLGDQGTALGQELGLVGRAGDQRGDLDRDLGVEV